MLLTLLLMLTEYLLNNKFLMANVIKDITLPHTVFMIEVFVLTLLCFIP